MVVDAAGVRDEDVRRWAAGLEEISARLSPHFARRDAHQRAMQYLRALVSPVERKNGWQLAEIAGERTPYGMQHLLGRAVWDVDLVRDALQAYVVAHLGDGEGMLILDETSFPKKGTKSAGVSRQYCGSLGKRENCQVGVLLAYAGPAGCAFIDRALYLPKAWTEDPERRREAGIPAEVPFLTKPEIGRQMLERALDGGAPARWVLADEIYGGDYRLRACVEDRHCRYVLGGGRQSVRLGRVGAAAGGRGHPGSGGERVEPAQLRRRDEGTAGVRLGAGPAHQPRGGMGAVGAVPALGRRAAGSRLLPGVRPQWHPTGRDRAGGRQSLAHRRGHRGSQGRGGTRPLRGPELAGLVPASHPGPAGACLPRRHPSHRGRPRGGKGGGGLSGRGDQPRRVPAAAEDDGLIRLSVAEIRKLVWRLVWAVTAASSPPCSAGRCGAGATKPSPEPATTSVACTASTSIYNCSTRLTPVPGSERTALAAQVQARCVVALGFRLPSYQDHDYVRG